MTERSIAMGPIHRAGAMALVAALAATAPWIGWLPFVAMGVGLGTLLAIKRPRVQRAWGASSVWASWGLTQLALLAVCLLAHGPAEYMVPLLAVPTIMATPVLPTRHVAPLAVVSALMVLAVGAAVDWERLADYPPAYFYTAMIVFVLATVQGLARRSEAASSWRAERDPLTGQFNRRALAEHTSSGPAPAAVLMVDIDRFKTVNDEDGHAAGDRILAAVGREIGRVVGTRGSVYRVGGEEFAVVVPPANTGVDARALGEEIRGAIGARPLGGRRVTVSVGVSEHGAAFAEMLGRADNAVYRAKAGGRDRVVAAEPLAAGPQRRRGDTATRPSLGAVDASSSPRAGDGPVRRLLEREHLIAMTERQRREATVQYLAAFGAQLAAVPWTGWTLVAGTACGAVVHRVAQMRVREWRNPQAVLMATWMVWQGACFAGALFIPDPPLWGLSGFALLLVTASSSFARPCAIAAGLYSALLVVATTAITKPSALWDSPQAWTGALAVVASVMLVGRALRMRALGLDTDASFDALTGLPNWKAWQASVQEWEATRARGTDRLALLLIDVDNLKAINDAHGHARGDDVIRGVAARLEGATRHEGALFRLGGEEFAMLVRDDDVDQVEAIGERLRRAVSDHLVAGLDVTVSIGAAVAFHGLDPGTLFDAADGALYGAKHGGRNRVNRAGGPGTGGSG